VQDAPEAAVPVEQALLDLCARQLTLEVRRLRLERRLRKAAADTPDAEELSRVIRLLSRAEGELSTQRRLIAALRSRQRAPRRAH
jgi:hypothetical protein